MDPENTYTTNTNFKSIFRANLKIILVFLGLVILILVTILFIRSLQFHIVKTDPSLNDIGSGSDNITIYFNKNLDPKSLDLALEFDTKTSYTVSGKTIVVKFHEPLTIDRTYSITIKSVKSIDGSLISNEVLQFVAKSILYENLPKNQQEALTKEENETPKPEPAQLNFEGTDELLNQGLSVEQIEGYKQAIIKYGEINKQSFQQIIIDRSSLASGPDQNTPGNFIVNFTVMIGKNKFSARLDYSGLLDVRLYLYDTNNKLIFDSQTINITS